MTRRRKTDGERIASKTFSFWYALNGEESPAVLARAIDRLLRKRMAEAWGEGWFDRDCNEKTADENPYRGRKKK